MSELSVQFQTPTPMEQLPGQRQSEESLALGEYEQVNQNGGYLMEGVRPDGSVAPVTEQDISESYEHADVPQPAIQLTSSRLNRGRSEAQQTTVGNSDIPVPGAPKRYHTRRERIEAERAEAKSQPQETADERFRRELKQGLKEQDVATSKNSIPRHRKEDGRHAMDNEASDNANTQVPELEDVTVQTAPKVNVPSDGQIGTPIFDQLRAERDEERNLRDFSDTRDGFRAIHEALQTGAPIPGATETEGKKVVVPSKGKEVELWRPERKQVAPIEERSKELAQQEPQESGEDALRRQLAELLDGVPKEDFDKYIGLRDSWTRLLAKRGMTSIASFRASRRRVGRASESYQQQLEVVVDSIRQSAQSRDMDSNSVEAVIDGFRAVAATDAVSRLTQYRVEQSQRHGRKFFDWWARQGGGARFFSRQRIVGTLKKSAVLAPVGAVAGAAAHLIESRTGLEPGTVGAMGGALVASAVARGLAAARIGRAAEEPRIAEMQSQSLLDSLRFVSPSSATFTRQTVNETNRSVERNVQRNRRRLIGAAAIGAVTAFGASRLIDGIFGGSTQVAQQEIPLPDSTPRIPTVTTPEASQLNLGGARWPWNYFANNYGAGRATPMINELMEKAREAGWRIDDAVAGPENQINSVTSPSGQTFYSTRRIVEMLEEFNRKS